MESSKDVVGSVARVTCFHSYMRKVAFQGANEVIYYDTAFSSTWGLLTSNLTYQLEKTVLWRYSPIQYSKHFFEFPRFCGSPMQDCVRAWMTALRMLSVQMKGLTVMKHDKCLNCRTAAVTPILINSVLAQVSSYEGSTAPLGNLIPMIEAGISRDS